MAQQRKVENKFVLFIFRLIFLVFAIGMVVIGNWVSPGSIEDYEYVSKVTLDYTEIVQSRESKTVGDDRETYTVYNVQYEGYVEGDLIEYVAYSSQTSSNSKDFASANPTYRVQVFETEDDYLLLELDDTLADYIQRETRSANFVKIVGFFLIGCFFLVIYSEYITKKNKKDEAMYVKETMKNWND